MGKPWFRFYERTLRSDKAQDLPGDLFKTWVNLLCIALQGDGSLPSMRNIARQTGVSEKDVIKRVELLVTAGLIDRNGDVLTPHDWAEMQFSGDVSTERVKAFRKRRETVSETVSETPDHVS